MTTNQKANLIYFRGKIIQKLKKSTSVLPNTGRKTGPASIMTVSRAKAALIQCATEQEWRSPVKHDPFSPIYNYSSLDCQFLQGTAHACFTPRS